MLRDPLLDELETQAAAANLSLQQAAANYEQARQLARAEHATLFPSLSVSASAERAKSGSARAGSLSHSSTGNSSAGVTNTYSTRLDAGWTPDFWGRLRRLTEADVATAQAGAADLAAARLSLQSTLAQDYVQLRVADERIRLRQGAVEAYNRTLAIAQNKYQAGVVARSDVLSAQAQLDAARAQVIDAGIQRAQLEHAIAVLVGKTPDALTLAPQPALGLPVPAIPEELPSTLLERRPDIAAAERRVAAANAQTGVQTAAFFPTITLTAAGGYEAAHVRDLFSAPAEFWSLGAGLAGTLLDFGTRRAQLAAARAGYEATVAGYRGAVLGAFQEIEDRPPGRF